MLLKMNVDYSMKIFILAFLAIAARAFSLPLTKRELSDLNPYAIDLFNQSMKFQDAFWDDDIGYLITADTTLPGRYDTRQTCWYAVGLIARNEGEDVERAERILTNVYANQYKTAGYPWYGDIQSCPEEPTPNVLTYPPEAYTSYDSNWRDFVGSAFVIILADYSDRLSSDGLETVKKMLYLFAKGDLNRVGGYDGDNLYPAFTNPWLMRCILQSYSGYIFNDKNMTDTAERWAEEVYDLYQIHETFSEFNSPTYTGVALWALGMWIRYSPDGSNLSTYAEEMLGPLMTLTKNLYNANLKNFAGPFDRSYGYDMNQYFSITAATVWGLVGREYAPMPKQIAGMYHAADFGMAHLIALGIPQVEDLISEEVKESFRAYPGEHSFETAAYSPPFDVYSRNISVWSSEYITIGAETISEANIGGPATSAEAFCPMVLQWYVRKNRVGYISLYATEPIIHATAGEGYFDITYPNITEYPGRNVIFSFLVSPFDIFPTDNITTMTSLPGLKLEVSGNIDSTETFYYDPSDAIHDFVFFNSTWEMPEDFIGVPHIHFDITEYPTTTNVSYSLSDL